MHVLCISQLAMLWSLQQLLVFGVVGGFVVVTPPPKAPIARHASGRRPQQEDASKVLAAKLGQLASSIQQEWLNGGWQVRKRAGRWLPEIVVQPLLEDGERTHPTAEIDWSSSRRSEGAKALASPSMTEGDRELAVARDFGQFLARSDVSTTFERREDGSIVFVSESALSATVAMFASEVTKELGAAARALARYVDDLEAELNSADAQVVKIKAEVADAANRAREKTEAAERAMAQAESLRQKQEKIEADLQLALKRARDFEENAEAASIRFIELEGDAMPGKLAEAMNKAAELENQLAEAQASILRQTEEAEAVAMRAENAEVLALAADRERSAVEGVAKAMEQRAIAAELSAEESRQRLEKVLVEASETEAKLSDALGEISEDEEVDVNLVAAAKSNDDESGTSDGVVEQMSGKAVEEGVVVQGQVEDAVQESIKDARDAVRAKIDLPAAGKASIWKMRKSELAKELKSYGRNPGKLKVSELRALVRVERLKESPAPSRKNASKKTQKDPLDVTQEASKVPTAPEEEATEEDNLSS